MGKGIKKVRLPHIRAAYLAVWSTSDPKVILNSFTIANARYEEVDDWRDATGKQMSKVAFEARHVLFQNEDKTTYLAKLLRKALQQ